MWTSDVRIPTTLCPYCGHTLSAAGTISGDAPQPSAGNFAVCIACAGVAVFTDRLRLAQILPEDLAEAFVADPEAGRDVARKRLAIQMMWVELGRPGQQPVFKN